MFSSRCTGNIPNLLEPNIKIFFVDFAQLSPAFSVLEKAEPLQKNSTNTGILEQWTEYDLSGGVNP